MNFLECTLIPVSSLVDIHSFGMVTSAKEQLGKLSLGDLLLITDYFTKHDRLNQIGEITMRKLADKIKETDEYIFIEKVI